MEKENNPRAADRGLASRGFFLADDLSGALDAAAGFHRAGRRVTVALAPDAWGDDPEAMAGCTTESRNLAPAAAASAVTAAIAEGRRRGAALVYKKIDSTLRGPVAAELGALLAALPEARVLFCPANPAAGRTVRAGVLRVRGVPVAETEFARDPVSPVRESAIRALLGPIASERVVIPDAETEADLAAAVAAMDAAGGPWVAVGSGALARPVAGRITAGAARPVASDRDLAPGPVLMICGSAHAGNRAQAAALTCRRGVPACEVRVRDPEPAIEAATWAARQAGAVTLILEGARAEPAAALAAMAFAATRVATQTGARRIFVTGGETAFAVCGTLGVRALDFRAEIEPGLGLARAGERMLAVKPGGFGDDDTWVRAFDRLRGNGD